MRGCAALFMLACMNKNQGTMDMQVQRRRVLLCAMAAGLSCTAEPALAASEPLVVAPTPRKTATKPEKSRLVLAINNRSALYYLPLTVAEQLGYFADEGLEVEVQDLGSTARVLQALAGGSADVVSGWLDNTLTQQGKGNMLQAFVLQSRAPQIALGLSPRIPLEPQSLVVLRGRRVGIVAPGTPSHTVAYAALARAGLRRDEMGFVSVGTSTSAMAALRAGQIDALCYSDPVMTLLEQRGELRIVADTRSLQGCAQVFGGDMPATALSAAQEFVQKHPHTVQALTDAMVRALKWLHMAGMSDLLRTVPESYFADDRALYLAAYMRMRDTVSSDGLISAEGMQNLQSALFAADPLLRNFRFDLQRSYSNSFALKAKQRFKV